MDQPGSSMNASNEHTEVSRQRGSSSSSDRSGRAVSDSEDPSESTSSQFETKEVVRKIPVPPSVGERVNLLDLDSLKLTKSLYEVAQSEMSKAGDGKPDIKLPTTSDQYYDLEEILMNPARMEGRELTLNAYDAVRAKYNVFPDTKIAEADMQKVIGSFSCDVCQELIQGSIMTKKCGHRFCDQCILVALMRSGNTCPTCRQNLGSKRELQQDPRFDQLIYQVVESRSIVHRMLASDREHERDVYFGRRGYIEGGGRWKNLNDGDDNGRNKHVPEVKESSKLKIRWFHEEDDDGTVPPSVDMNEIEKSTNESKRSRKRKNRANELIFLGDDSGEKVERTVINPATSSSKVEDTDSHAMQDKSYKGAIEPAQENGNVIDDYTAISCSNDKDIDVAKDRCEDREEGVNCLVNSAEEKESGKNLNVTERAGNDRNEEIQIESGSESELSVTYIDDEEDEVETLSEEHRNTSVDSSSDDSMRRDTRRQKKRLRHGKKTSAESGSKNDAPGESDDEENSDDSRVGKRSNKNRKKKADLSFTEDSDESSSSSEEEQDQELEESDVNADKQTNQKNKKLSGHSKKSKREKQDGEELSDIPTPSEDSLTSSSEDSDDSVDPYGFVFRDEFNRDPRRDGHPERDKLYNFDFMIDMDAEIIRRHEEDGAPKVISDDSNSESDLEESDSVGSQLLSFDSEHQKEISKFLDKQSRSQSIETNDAGENTEMISTLEPTRPNDESSTLLASKSADMGSAGRKLPAPREELGLDEEDDFDPAKEMSSEVHLDEKTAALLDGKTQMFQGFLFRESDTGPDRPRLERAPFLDNEPLNLRPQNVFVLCDDEDLQPIYDVAVPFEDRRTLQRKLVHELESGDTAERPNIVPLETNVPASKPSNSASELIEASCSQQPSTSVQMETIESSDSESSEDSFEEEELQFSDNDNQPLDREHFFLAHPKPIVENRVFYDTVAPLLPAKIDRAAWKEAEQMTTESVERLTERQVAFEEGRSHRRRAAVADALEAATKALDINLDSSEDEDDDDDEEEDDDEGMEEESDVNSCRDMKSVTSGKQSSRASSVQRAQIPEIGETQIEDLFFDPNEPCSSAQAAQRAHVMDRVEREQQIIEDSILEQNKSCSFEPSVGTAAKMPDNEILPNKGDETVETNADGNEDALSDTEEAINEGTNRVEMKKTILVTEQESDDDEDFDTRYGDFLKTIDAKLLKPTITDYVANELVKTVAQPPPNTSDEALIMNFCLRNTASEFETIQKTGQKPLKNTDDEDLENLVKRFDKDYTERNEVKSFNRPLINVERMYIERAHNVKYNNVVNIDPLHLQILIALQKQQLAIARANTSDPYTVTPDEHVEQVRLLQQIQNPSVLGQLIANPQFASTLVQAQHQAMQQQQVAQRAQQKAQQEKELAARRAEQMRVEELARKRIAQEDAEKAARENKTAVTAGSDVSSLPENGHAAVTEATDVVGERVGNPIEKSSDEANSAIITLEADAAPQVTVETVVKQLPEQTMEVDNQTKVTPEAVKTSDLFSATTERATKRPSRPTSAHVETSTPQVQRPRLGSDCSAVKTIRGSFKRNSSRSRSPIVRKTIVEVEDTMADEQETILAGNVTHIVDTTILTDESELGNRPNDNSEACDTSGEDLDEWDVDESLMDTHFSDQTIELDDSQRSFVSLHLEYQKSIEEMREDEMNREILQYANRYHQNAMFAATQLLEVKRMMNGPLPVMHEEPEKETVGEEPSGEEGKEDLNKNENPDDPTVEEMEAAINIEEEALKKKSEQLELAKKLLRQRQGLESSDSENETESEEEVETVDSDMDGSSKRVIRSRSKVFVPNIPFKIRRKYVERKHEMERAKYRARIKAQKMANIRISVPQKSQFAAPQPPNRTPKQPTAPRATPKPKKPKMANVNAPTKITAVPNVAVGYAHQPAQVYTDMAHVPQSTPIRSNNVTQQQGATLTPHAQSHLAQLGQFVHGAAQHPQQMNPAQLQAHLKMIQTAQSQGAQPAQGGQPLPQMVAPGHIAYNQHVQQANLQQMTPAQAQMMEERRKLEEMNAVYHLLQSRGQFPPQNQEIFHMHFAQAQADLRNAQAQSQIANAVKAQTEAARLKHAQEQARAQAAAKEAARRKAEAEAAAARAKQEAEAKLKAEQERARQAQAHAKLLEAQARAAMEAKQKAAQAAAQGLPPGMTMQQMQHLQYQQQVQYQQQMHHVQQMQQMQQAFAARMQQGTPKVGGMPGGPMMQNMPPPPAPGFPGLHPMQGMPMMHGMPGIPGVPGIPGMQMMPVTGMVGIPMQGIQGPMPGMPPATPAPAVPPQPNQQNSQQQLLAQLQLQQQLMLQQQLQQLGQQVPNPYAQQVPNPYAQQVPQAVQHMPVVQHQHPAPVPAQLVPPHSITVVPQPVPAAPQAAPVVQPTAPAVPQVVVDPRIQVPPVAPKPVQATVPKTVEQVRSESTVSDKSNGDVELEIWPTNGYAEKKRQQGSATNPTMYFASRGDSTFYHVACLVRSRSTCNANDIGSLWVLRIEDQSVMQFQLHQTLAEAQLFVGRQHLIIFYDDVLAGEVHQSKEYIINKDFKPNSIPRAN